MRRFAVIVVLLTLPSCTERKYTERLLPGRLYVEVQDTSITSLTLIRDGKTVYEGNVRTFYRTSYYAGSRYGNLKVYLPTGYGCARADVELSSTGCGVVVVPDTPSTSGGCPDCDSMETRRTTIIDVLTWERPVAVKMGDRCLPVYATGRVRAFYVDSLLPGRYLLVVGGDTDTVFVSSEKCTKVNAGGNP